MRQQGKKSRVMEAARLRALKLELAEIIGVIRKSATTRGTMPGKDGTMCVWGGLADHVGVPPRVYQYSPTRGQRKAVNTRFPLLNLGSSKQVGRLLSINDDYMETGPRRRALIQFIRDHAVKIVAEMR